MTVRGAGLPGCGLATIAIAALFACEADPRPDPGPIVRDSAGIRIIEARGTDVTTASWRIDSRPELRIGAVDGDPSYLLSRVVGALRLRDGRVAIGNGHSHELRFYDPRGRFLSARGREGEGPGEFTYMRGLGRCREEGIVAFDLNWQMNTYDDDGTFVDRRQLLAPDGISPYNLACDERGRVVLLGWGLDVTGAPQIGFHQARGPLVLVDGEGSVATDFGEWLVSERIGTMGGSRPHPFGRATVFALHDDHLYVGSGERFEVEVRSLDGTLRRLVRGPSPSLEIEDSLRAAYLAEQLANARPERHPVVRQEVAEMEWPPAYPAYTALRVDPSGVAWLRRFAVGTSRPEQWGLLDPARGYLGDVTLPAGHTLVDVGIDYVLVMALDELDVETVALHVLHREGTSGDGMPDAEAYGRAPPTSPQPGNAP